MPAERRREERVSAGAAIRIRFKSQHDLEEYYLRDISHGGMFIATRKLHPLGTLLTLLVVLPDGDELRLQGRVVHVRTPEQIAPGLPAGVGVQFEGLTTEVARRIESSVSKLATARPPVTPPSLATQEDFELLRRLCWIFCRGSLGDRPLEEVLGVPGAAPAAARRETFRQLRSALGLDRPPPFLASEDRWELERKLRMIETIVELAD